VCSPLSWRGGKNVPECRYPMAEYFYDITTAGRDDVRQPGFRVMHPRALPDGMGPRRRLALVTDYIRVRWVFNGSTRWSGQDRRLHRHQHEDVAGTQYGPVLHRTGIPEKGGRGCTCA